MSAQPPVTLYWNERESTVRWDYRGTAVVKTFSEPPQSVLVVVDPPSVIVVEAIDESGKRLDNAVVYEPDGRERLRLVPPSLGEPHWRRGFYEVYSDPYGVVAVFTTTVGDFWGRPNLETGALHNVSESR